MASTMVYMFALLALASGMVVLMFGFSSTHSSMYSLQTSFEEHDRVLRRSRETEHELTRQVADLQKAVQELRGAGQKQQALIESQGETLSKGVPQLQEVSNQVQQLQRDLGHVRDDQKAATTAVEEVRSLASGHEHALQAVTAAKSEMEPRLDQLVAKQQALQEQLSAHEKVEQRLEELASKLQALQDQLNAHEKVEQRLDKLTSEQQAMLKQLSNDEEAQKRMLGGLKSTVDDVGRQQLAQSILLEQHGHELHDARTAPPLAASPAEASPGDSIGSQARVAGAAGDSLPTSPSTPARSSAKSQITGATGGDGGHGGSAEGAGASPSTAHSSLKLRRGEDAADQRDRRTRAEVLGDLVDILGASSGVQGKKHPGPVQPSTPAAAADAPSSSAGASLRQPSAAAAAPSVSSSSRKARRSFSGHEYRVSWYRECGCTGMEIEAVTLLAGLASRIGTALVQTNKCSDTCTWPASTRSLLEQIEVSEDSQLAEQPASASNAEGKETILVLVIHAAFTGVCGMPDSILLPQRKHEDPISEPDRGLFRVSRSMLETDRLDQDAARLCNEQFDAVWVPSAFNVQTFSQSGVSKDSLQVLPEAVDMSLYNCSSGAPPPRPFAQSFKHERLDAFLQKAVRGSVFTFLSIFKWEERKNWRGLLEAFFAAFPQGLTEVQLEDGPRVNMTVRLLIKTQELSWGTNPEMDLEESMFLLDEGTQASLNERVLIIKDAISSDMMPSTYHAADAFVLPTHGEGWGLPLMEAMASGLPTIATNWGGQTEFMNDGNSLLLGYELVDSPSAPGHMWAEPKNAELQAAMRQVLRSTKAVKAKVERACREVHERYNQEVIAQRAVELIGQLLAAPSNSHA